MIRAHTRDTLAAEERQTLLESARVCEMILEANSADTVALETLKEIYTKLGDRDRLMQVLSALAVFSDVSASGGVAASKADELNELPAEPNPGPGLLPGPSSERRPGALRRSAHRRRTHHARAACPGADGPERHARQARHHPRPAGGPRGGEPPRLSVASAQRAYVRHADTSSRHRPRGAEARARGQIARGSTRCCRSSGRQRLTLAMADPADLLAIDDVEFMTALQVATRSCPRPVAVRRPSRALLREQVLRGELAALSRELESAAAPDVEVVEGEEESTWAKLATSSS